MKCPRCGYAVHDPRVDAGRSGGHARKAKQSAAQLSAIGKRAATVRWQNHVKKEKQR